MHCLRLSLNDETIDDHQIFHADAAGTLRPAPPSSMTKSRRFNSVPYQPGPDL
jgi:hypothetical protein